MDSDVAVLLAELGFIAGDHGMSSHADRVADALMAAQPDSAKPLLIKAYARLGERDAAGAEKLIRQALESHPDDANAKAMLGLALHMAGKGAERDSVMAEVISAGGDEHAVEIANKLKGAPLSG